MADQRSALKILFSCKIHIKTSPVSVLASALPPIFYSFFYLILSVIFDIKELWLKRSFRSQPETAFFLPRGKASNAQALLGTKAHAGTLLLENHKSRTLDPSVQGSACFGPSLEKDLSGSPLTLSIYSRAPVDATWMKRA